MTRLLLAVLSIAAAAPARADLIAPFTLNLSQLGGSASYSGLTIASGLNFEYGLSTTANGSIVFGQSTPTSSVGLLYGNGPDTTGSVWIEPKLPDGSFGAPQKIVDGLTGVVTDVRTLSNGYLLVDSGAGGAGGSGTRVMSFYTQTGTLVGSMNFTYPSGGWEHSTGMSYVVGNANGTDTIYFIVGSQADDAATTATVTTSGLVTSTLKGDSVYSMVVDPTGGQVQIVSAPVQIATGLRNPFGLSFDSLGDLIIGDNGIDGAHPVNELGADTLDLIPADLIGTQLFDFGFPNSYVNFATGQYVSGDPGATPPLAAFLPVEDSMGNLQSSEGLSDMAYAAPGSLPFVGPEGGEIIGFHGVFDAGGSANYDNALEYYDFASGLYYPILDAGTPGVGHIDSVAIDGHVLYLGEMTSTGLVNGLAGLGGGDIYEFDFSSAYVPEPSTWMLGALGSAALLISRRRLLLGATAGVLQARNAPYGAVPSPRQLQWHKMEVYGFLHFTVNTFTGREWGNGDEDPSIFNPTAFDADAIVAGLKAGGMRGVILTCKHHDGFCLWPTKATEHCVRNSSWRAGKGDVVRNISDAARRAGLKFGVYLSPWDRNSAFYGKPEYLQIYRQQLTELLTGYGDIFEVWFDGANGGDGYYGGAREKRLIDKTTYYEWPKTWDLVRSLQPNASIFSDVGPDIRWVGNERGHANETCWETYDPVGLEGGAPVPGRVRDKDGQVGTRNGSHWMPPECDVSIRPGWFWHAEEDTRVKSARQLMDLYYQSVGRGGSLLLNVPPDRRGLLGDADLASLKAFGTMVSNTFRDNLLAHARIKKDVYSTPQDISFDVIKLREDISLGQRVDAFEVDSWKDGSWSTIAKGTSIGACRLIRLPERVTTKQLRLRITQSAATPVLAEFGAFLEA